MMSRASGEWSVLDGATVPEELREVMVREGSSVRVSGEVADSDIDELVNFAFEALGGSVRLEGGGNVQVLYAGWARPTWELRGAVPREGTPAFALQAPAHAMAVSRDESMVAVVCTEGFSVVIALFDGAGKILHQFNAREGRGTMHPYYGHACRSARVAFSDDGALLYSAGMDNFVRVWDTRRGTLIARMQLDKHPRAVAFDGSRLCCVMEGEATYYEMADLAKGALSSTKHKYIMRKVECFDALADRVLASARLGTELGRSDYVSVGYESVTLGERWCAGSTGSAVEVRSLDGFDGEPWTVSLEGPAHCLLFDGDIVFVVSERRVLSLNPEAQTTTTVITLSPGQRFNGVASRFGSGLLVGTPGQLVFMDLDEPKLSRPTGLGAGILAPNGERILVTTGEEESTLVDVATHASIAVLPARFLRFSSDSSVLISQSSPARFFAADDGRELGVLELDDADVSAAFLDGRGRIGVLTYERRARVYDQSGVRLLDVPGEELVFGGDRVSVRSDRSWTVYDYEGGELPTNARSLPIANGCLVSGPTLHRLNMDGTMRWELPFDGGHLVVSPCERFLATGGGVTRLIDTATGEVLLDVVAHPFAPQVAVTSEGALVTLGSEGSVTRSAGFGDASEVSRLAETLGALLAETSENRRQAQGAPLKDIAYERGSPLQDLPAVPVAHGVRFARPQVEYADDGDWLHKSEERTWRIDYNKDDEQIIVVSDESSKEFARFPWPEGMELEVAPAGKLAIARVDGVLRQMYGWDRTLNIDHEPNEELDEGLVSIMVLDDTGKEVTTIVPQMRGPGLEVGSEIRWGGDLLVFEVSHEDAEQIEVWNARTGTYLWRCERNSICVLADALVALEWSNSGDKSLVIFDLESGEERLRCSLEDAPDSLDIVDAGHGKFALVGGGHADIYTAKGELETRVPTPATEGKLSDDAERWESHGRAWRVSDGCALHDHANDLVVLTADESMIASMDENGEVIVRDYEGRVSHRLALTTYERRAAFGFGFGYLALVDDGMLTLIEVATGRARTCSLRVLDVYLKSGELYTLDQGGAVRRWKLESGIQETMAEVPGATRFTLARNADVMLAWGSDALLKTDLATNATEEVFSGYVSIEPAIADDGKSFFYGGEQPTIVWNSDTSQYLDSSAVGASFLDGAWWVRRWEDVLVLRRDEGALRGELVTQSLATIGTQLITATREGIDVRPLESVSFTPYDLPDAY